MALIKTEKLECDICGSCRGVQPFEFKVYGLSCNDEVIAIANKDLCPACLKRAIKFLSRGLSKPELDESNAVAPRTGA